MKIFSGDNYRFEVGFRNFKDQDPYFSITGTEWEQGKPKTERNIIRSGTIEIGPFVPEMAFLDKYHLCRVKEPMHYIANSLYCASDRDYRGLRKGEKMQSRTRDGIPVWNRECKDKDGKEVDIYSLWSWKDSETVPEDEILTISWVPKLIIGEGKEPDLDLARKYAVWPDAELKDFTKEKLEARLPQLMAQFRRDVESVGIEWPCENN